MRKYSNRAKRGLTTALRAQLKQAKSTVASHRYELKKSRSLLKYNLPGTRMMIKHAQYGLIKTKNDLRLIKARIKKYHKQGLCYKIL